MYSNLMTIFSLVGGLGLFLYGMQLMADGLQKIAGDRLRRLIETLTRTPLFGMLVGATVTVLIQSSSATSVMVVGFINAGLMTLAEGLSIIMGAAVGTTVTAFMVSLRLTDLAMPAIFLGFLLAFAGKRKRTKFVGQAIMGFGILFLGLTTMGDAMKPLRTNPFFTGMMLRFSETPLLGVIASAVFTAIIQSSSATTGLVVTLAAEGLLDLNSSFSLILGANIGTTVTALLASVTMHLSAKRAALAQLIFKSAGVILFLPFFRPFLSIVSLLATQASTQAAYAHIIFNVANALIMLPLIPFYVRLVERLLPGTDTTEQPGAIYLDLNLLGTPSVALGQATKELRRMGDLALQMYDQALNAFIENEGSHLGEIAHAEATMDRLEHDIVDYLVQLSQISLSNEQSERLNALLHVSSDMERIGDHIENIAELADYRIDHRLPVSPEAETELLDMGQKVRSLVENAIHILLTNDLTEAEAVIAAEGNIDLLEKSLRRQHIRRLNSGVCFPASGILYLDLISNLERIADHANNIAEALAGTEEGKNGSLPRSS